MEKFLFESLTKSFIKPFIKKCIHYKIHERNKADWIQLLRKYSNLREKTVSNLKQKAAFRKISLELKQIFEEKHISIPTDLKHKL